MADDCSLCGMIRVSPDIDLAAVKAAILLELGRAESHITDLDRSDIARLISADIGDEEHIAFDGDRVDVAINLRGDAGAFSPEAQAIASALGTLAAEPGWLVMVDHQVSPSTDGATMLYAVGRTPHERDLARALYGLSLAEDYWCHPALEDLRLVIEATLRQRLAMTAEAEPTDASLAIQPEVTHQPGEVPGHGWPDWPEDLQTFEERSAYQRGIADARHIAEQRPGTLPSAPALIISAEGKFDLVVEAVRTWDEHETDGQPSRMCVIVPDVDAGLLDRLSMTAHLVRLGDLAEGAIGTSAIWGDDIGSEDRSRLVVNDVGTVRITAENDRGVYESLPFSVESLLQAWKNGMTADQRVQRHGDVLFAGVPEEMEWLVRAGTQARDIWRSAAEPPDDMSTSPRQRSGAPRG